MPFKVKSHANEPERLKRHCFLNHFTVQTPVSIKNSNCLNYNVTRGGGGEKCQKSVTHYFNGPFYFITHDSDLISSFAVFDHSVIKHDYIGMHALLLHDCKQKGLNERNFNSEKEFKFENAISNSS